jgi:4-alpha-glucanotransferase
VSSSYDGPFEAVSEFLARLAGAHGVATEYWDQAGRLVSVSATTVRAVLTSLGVASGSEAEVVAELERAALRDWRRTLPTTFIGRAGEDRRLPVHVPHGEKVVARVELEDGSRRQLDQMDWWVDPMLVDGVLTGEASFTVPGDLPLGWHTVIAQTAQTLTSSTLVMTPRRLDPERVIGERQWGFMAQIYATRSRRSWGIGDLRDCADLASWSGRRLGAGFLLINPLHAAAPSAPMAPSPYLPVTRRFANPLYLRIEDIPEFVALPAETRERAEARALAMQQLNLTDSLLDRDACWAAKRSVLESIAAIPLTPDRAARFHDYCLREGQGLVDFATWCVMSDMFGDDPVEWPAGLDHPRNDAVADFRGAHAQAVDFHRWLQWQLDTQLARAQRAAREAGMAIGVMHDLAVGVHPAGSDAWALQDVLAAGVSVGAPPDMYNQMGQDWSQPPWRPDALAEAGFGPYRDMLRTVLRNAGGMRIDHVLGLFRLWWVPRGRPASEGTFVRLDHDAMLGILCLEAHRAGAVIVGEDLGTVEPWVQEALADRGILGTSILWFEKQDSGAVKPPATWRREVLASVTVHDLPPTAGYLRDEHVRIRADLGLLTRPAEVERADADRERHEWAGLLRSEGWLDQSADIATDEGLEAMLVALHRALAASPARLLGVSLPDAFGDRRAQNQPGTDQEYPNWRVPMTDSSGAPVLLDDCYAAPERVEQLVATVRPSVGRAKPLGL